MVPVPATEDYYMILEVVQTATPEQIIRAYKRLALKLHPDRNAKHDATEAFQLLGKAYETLKDESRRRDYDLIYPSIKQSRTSPQTTQTSRPPPASTPQSEALADAAQIAALQKSKEERGARWQTKKKTFDSAIFELQRAIRRLEQDIKNLDTIVAAEAAEEARKNSWGTWLLSPIYKKAEDSEEVKARKDRARQERRIEKDMKERRLASAKADLKREESLLRKAKEEVDAADLADSRKLGVIRDRIRARETRERQERERVERMERERIARVERERIAKIRKQQQEQREKQQREAEEALRKHQAEQRAAEQKWLEEQTKKWQKIRDDQNKRYQEQYAQSNLREDFFAEGSSTPQASTSACRHGGWWSKVQGRKACPECYDVWTYLLQCPGCEKKACPKCQAAIRPRRQRNAARTNRRAPESPRPDFFRGDFY